MTAADKLAHTEAVAAEPAEHDSAEHGGDLAAMRAAFPAAPRPWIDLSTGINPWAYPVSRIPRSAWHRLPSADDEQSVRLAAARYYDVDAATTDVVLAPGSQALIQWLPRLRPHSRVAVVGPTYSEHARSWVAGGHDVLTVGADADALRDSDVVVVTRPNNPDGAVMPLLRLTELADRLQRRRGWLVIDEAFADVADARSVAATLPQASVVCLRSFGKFFGLAGGRLGVALARPPVSDALRAALGPWPASTPMLAIAARAFADRAWIRRTRSRLKRAADRLDRIAVRAGLRLVGGTSLFRLYETGLAEPLFEHLAARGIYARRFAAEPGWLRLGLIADAGGERRLRRALAAFAWQQPH